MKKLLLITLLIFTLVLTCSCVEELESDTAPGLGPIATETAPDSQKPIDSIDHDDIPSDTDPTSDPTDPDDPTDPNGSNESTDQSGDEPTEPDNPDEPTLTDISLDNGADADGKAVTTILSGYVSNSESSAEGKVVKKVTSGDKTIYRVPYVRTMTYVVEVTPVGDNIQVEVYLEHYRLAMGKGKLVTVTIGDYSGSAATAEIEWDENQKSAKTLLMKAIAPKGEGNSVKIEAKMLFGGTYHNEKIDVMELSETLYLN